MGFTSPVSDNYPITLQLCRLVYNMAISTQGKIGMMRKNVGSYHRTNYGLDDV
jgi:hypothetical protein